MFLNHRFSAVLTFCVSMTFVGALNLNAQSIFASWNFDAASKNPSVGSGTISLIGGVVEDFTKTGLSQGLSSPAGIDETTITLSGSGLQLTNFPLQKTNPLTAGIQIQLNTTGYKNIILSFDIRHGSSSANKVSLLFTADGINWQRAATFTETKDNTWYLRNLNFSNFPEVNDNPLFALKLVTNYDSIQYVPVKSTTVYAVASPIRFDNICFAGDSISKADDNRNVISGWNFEDSDLLVDSGNIGTLSTVGGTTVLWGKTGVIPNSTILNEGVYSFGKIEDGIALQTLNYPIQNTLRKSSGIQIMSNTISYKDIVFEADIRQGNTSANKLVLQYTSNGLSWNDITSYTINSGDTWYKRLYDFSKLSDVNNNANFGLRIVSDFNSAAYMPVDPTKIYAVTGPVRFDNILIKGRLINNIPSNPISQLKFRITKESITFESLPESNIHIYSINGIQLIDSQPLLQLQHNLPKGIYLLKIGSESTKFVIL